MGNNEEDHPLVINEDNQVENTINNETTQNRNVEPLGVRAQRKSLASTEFDEYQKRVFPKLHNGNARRSQQ